MSFSAVLLAACSSSLPPVDVSAPPETLARLQGDWIGSYNSEDTGRHGSIAFLLTSDADSAFGDVIMEPREHDWESHDPSYEALRRNHSERIRIAFVRFLGETVVGELAPYQDPDCGCTLTTVFRGKVEDGRMSGTFSSRHGMTDHVDEGEWSVERRHTASRTEAVAARGSEVMPFDLDRSRHYFEKKEFGGIQRVVSLDGDAGQVALIREHLAHEAERFAAGDFHDPAHIHGEDMAGLHALATGHKKLRISYTDVDKGGQIRYESDDRELVKALHAWFDQQVADHGKHAHG